MIACRQEPASIAAPQTADTEQVGFSAVITGAYQASVTGAGVLALLPQGGFEKQGYLFLADGQGLRPYGVTFVLPTGSGLGRHELENPSPIDIGTVPSVRVDRDTGEAVTSFQTNTAGFIELTAFPADVVNPSGSLVAGRFEFDTENEEGDRIRVAGEFSFVSP